MLKKICTALAGIALAVTITTGSGLAEETSFSDVQREQLHQIIRDYLIENPEIIREALEALQRQQEELELVALRDNVRNNAQQLFRSQSDFVFGNPNGGVTMVEFFDYNCGYCKRSLEDVLTLVETDPDLRLVLKEFPILGPGSLIASRAAIASMKQGKYWEFHLAMMQARGTNSEEQVMAIAADVGLDIEQLASDMNAPEVEQTIQQNYMLAEMMGIQGTPAFFIDDRLIPGALGVEGLRQQISEVRDSGNCVAC